MSETENTLDGMNGGFDFAKEKVKRLKDIVIKDIQNEAQRKRKNK